MKWQSINEVFTSCRSQYVMCHKSDMGCKNEDVFAVFAKCCENRYLLQRSNGYDLLVNE